MRRPMKNAPKLLDRVRERIRTKHYSIRTEDAYADWIRRFILFHGKRHPRELEAKHVESFLTYLAVERRVSASTQSQAKSALLFLYKEVLQEELPWLSGIVRAKQSRRLSAGAHGPGGARRALVHGGRASAHRASALRRGAVAYGGGAPARERREFRTRRNRGA
jgi:hypothetical protein